MSARDQPPVRDSLDQARELLYLINKQDTVDEEGLAGRVLECAFRLLGSIYSSIQNGRSVTLDPSDTTLVKAVLELVVRWGIYPHLSPGVGIPLDKRFGGKSAAAAAAAMKKHFSGVPDLPAQPSAVEPTSLLQSAEFLASLILDSPQRNNAESSDMEKKIPGNSLQPASFEDSSNVQVAPTSSTEGQIQIENTAYPAAALHQLVTFYHLHDLCAAYIQLVNTGKEKWRQLAYERLEELVTFLPVANMVEALLTLLGQNKPDPPSWLKEKAGKMLSKLLLRNGGVAAAMERLVGGIQTGNVKAYEHIALHLAKIPKLVTTIQVYYAAVCPQLPPLFLPPLPSEWGSVEGTLAARMVINIHHTAIILACKLAAHDSRLFEEYLLTPLLRPFLDWGEQITSHNKLEVSTENEDDDSRGFQGRLVDSDSQAPSASQGYSELGEERETWLVNALIGMHIFITSSHDGAECIQQSLVQLFEPLTDVFLSLRGLLVPMSVERRPKQLDSEQTLCSLSSTQGDAGTQGAASSNKVDRLRAAVSDIVEALHKQPIDESSVSLAGLNAAIMKWPRQNGEIWEALEAGLQRVLIVSNQVPHQ